LTIGIILIVLGALALFGSLGLFAVFGTDNTATSPSFQVAGNGRAVVWGTGLIRQATAVPSRFTNSIAIQIEAGERDMFVGIGPTPQVARYLAGVPVDRVTDVGWPSRVLVTRSTSGSAVPAPPADQTFWAAKASGSGAQRIDWTIEAGAWTVVVMNTDGAPGVDASGKASLHIGAIAAVMVVLLVIGLALVGGGIALIVTGRRRRGADQSGSAPPLAPATPAVPWTPREEPARPDQGSPPPADQAPPPADQTPPS
jgi:hypothetical protein